MKFTLRGKIRKGTTQDKRHPRHKGEESPLNTTPPKYVLFLMWGSKLLGMGERGGQSHIAPAQKNSYEGDGVKKRGKHYRLQM